MKQITVFLFFLLSIAGFFSCANVGCNETRETICFVDIKKTSTDTLKQVNVWYRDTLLSSSTSPQSMEFILRPDTTSTSYYFDMIVGTPERALQLTDTLEIKYEVFPYFINMECGCTAYFTISEARITGHFLKEATIISKDITNEENINIRIEY